MTTQEVRDLVVEGWKAIGFVEDDYDATDEAIFWLLHGQFCKWRPPKQADSVKHYAITLTTSGKRDVSHLKDTLKKILTSKSIAPEHFEWCIEDTKAGMPHIHAYIKTNNYVRARDVLRFNSGDRVDVKIIKGLAIPKWTNYIAKEEVPRTELPE